MKKFFLSICLILLYTLLFAQEEISFDSESKTLQKQYSHSQVALTAWIPFTGSMLSSLTCFMPQYSQYALVGITLLDNVPHCIIDPKEGITDTLISAGLFSTGFITAQYPELYGNQSFSHVFLNSGLKYSWWSQYQGYAKARSMAEPGIYPEYKVLTFQDAFFAPYNPEVLKKQSVWIPIASWTALMAGYYSMSGFNNCVWNTGKAYIGNQEVPIMLGFVSTFALACISYTFTGIGEESMFRGTEYEEMKISCGVVPAKILDATSFAAIHVPQAVAGGYNWDTIALSYAATTATALLFQWIYDQGGLKDSIAAHMWFDVINASLSYLFFAGKADNGLSLNVSFAIPLQ